MESSRKKIFFGGPIITLEEDSLRVQAIGIEGEHIVATGSLDDVKKKMGSDYELIDLEGNTIVPGFIDSHIHPIMYMFFLFNLSLSNIKSYEELIEALKNASKEKKSDEILLGLSFNEEFFTNPEERKIPTRWDLDQASTEIPIFILRYDGHIGIANSRTLEFIGIDSTTDVPEGGEICRDESGELTGVITEHAIALILSKVSLPNPENINAAAEKAFNNLAEKGITSLHGIVHLTAGGEAGDLGSMEIPVLKIIQDKVLQNLYLLCFSENVKKLKRIKKPPLDRMQEDSKFKVGGLKLFIDGSFGGLTACMHEPFTDHPDKSGFLVVKEAELYEKMKIAHNLGFQIAIHAIGDKGNRVLVNLYEKLLSEFPRENHRHRIEHASMLTSDVINDMKKLGLIASVQPPFINTEFEWLEKRLGKERCLYTYPIKTLIQNGIKVISGSDCPVEDPDVILGIHALVNRNGFIPEECISVTNALKTYTIDAAYASFEENVKGTLKSGKLADLVILDQDILSVPLDKIKEIKILQTLIRGKTVFKR